MDGEQLVRKSVGEIVPIGEVDLRERTGESHRIAPGVYLAASGYRPTRVSTIATTSSTWSPAAPVNAFLSASAASSAARSSGRRSSAASRARRAGSAPRLRLA